MGLNAIDIELLLASKRYLNKPRILFLGRQQLYITNKGWHSLRSNFKIQGSKPVWADYADDFMFKLFEATEVTSVDASGFEGADILCDFNKPVEKEYHGKFDLVIDGGTLEHVYNFPQAIKNLKDLVSPGGVLFTANPANSLCGHGFYQFSPELFFRCVGDDPSFQTLISLITLHRYSSVELEEPYRLYEAIDPSIVGRRGEFKSKTPAVLRNLYVRTSSQEQFSSGVTQSDYSDRWSEEKVQNKSTNSLKSTLKRMTPAKIRQIFKDKKTLDKNPCFKHISRNSCIEKIRFNQQ